MDEDDSKKPKRRVPLVRRDLGEEELLNNAGAIRMLLAQMDDTEDRLQSVSAERDRDRALVVNLRDEREALRIDNAKAQVAARHAVAFDLLIGIGGVLAGWSLGVAAQQEFVKEVGVTMLVIGSVGRLASVLAGVTVPGWLLSLGRWLVSFRKSDGRKEEGAD